MGFAYALPYTPPVTPQPDWGDMLITWTGWDGSEWTLSDRSTGSVLRAGVRGLNVPPTTRYADTSPGVAGSMHRGSSTQEREVFWPIKIFHGDGSQAWVDRDRAFWRTMHPDKPGVWTVQQPNGATRSLTCCFDNDGGQASDILPSLQRWAHYGIYLVAEQPFWVGDPVIQSWKAPIVQPFYEPDGPALVNITSGYTVDKATISNPGDEESYPTWYLDGPITSAAVGINGATATVPFAIAAGKCLVINADPKSLGTTLYDISPAELAKDEEDRMRPSDRVVGVDLINPVDKTTALGETSRAAIPPGIDVPLAITMVGQGIIEANLPTLYRRAW